MGKGTEAETSSPFKAKVVPAMLAGDKTLAELARQLHVRQFGNRVSLLL